VLFRRIEGLEDLCDRPSREVPLDLAAEGGPRLSADLAHHA
jgi:hypothetical protein